MIVFAFTAMSEADLGIFLISLTALGLGGWLFFGSRAKEKAEISTCSGFAESNAVRKKHRPRQQLWSSVALIGLYVFSRVVLRLLR